MIRTKTLISVDDETQQLCCMLSQSNCNCECVDCAGSCNDCVDCPNLTIANVAMLVYRAGDLSTTLLRPSPPFPEGTPTPNFLLTYGAYTLVGQVVCFYLDNQILALVPGRYIGEVQVNGATAGNIEFLIGTSYSVCQPYKTENAGYGNDMQPS
jgi:hypothetical protein